MEIKYYTLHQWIKEITIRKFSDVDENENATYQNDLLYPGFKGDICSYTYVKSPFGEDEGERDCTEPNVYRG